MTTVYALLLTMIIAGDPGTIEGNGASIVVERTFTGRYAIAQCWRYAAARKVRGDGVAIGCASKDDLERFVVMTFKAPAAAKDKR